MKWKNDAFTLLTLLSSLMRAFCCCSQLCSRSETYTRNAMAHRTTFLPLPVVNVPLLDNYIVAEPTDFTQKFYIHKPHGCGKLHHAHSSRQPSYGSARTISQSTVLPPA